MVWNGYTPSTLLPVIAVIAVILGILYLIRVRRKTLVVPYLGLWKNITHKRKKWLDNLKRLLSFLIWMLIALLVALALMDPRVETDESATRHVILVFDTSASMGATLDQADCKTRLACAQKDAHDAIDHMSVHDRMTIIDAAGNVRAATAFTADKDLLHRTVDELTLKASDDSMRDAFNLANQLTKDRENAEIVLFSDGQFEKDAINLEKLSLDVAFAQKTYGMPTQNLAIEAFNVRRYIANRLAFEAFIKVHNAFDVPVTAKLTVYNLDENAQKLTENATVIAEKTLTLASGSSELRIYDNLNLSSSRMAAQITIQDPKDTQDVLREDDIAYARIPDFARPDILCLTPGNLYLEAALLLNENYRVKIEKPETYLQDGVIDVQKLASAHDIVILDNSYQNLPPLTETNAAGRVLFINPRDGEAPFKQAAIKDPVIERVNAKHTISRWLSLKNLNIAEANVFKNVKNDDIVLRAIEGPLIVTQKTDERRALAIGFSLVESDLIFRVALPVLIINAVDWFMDEGGDPVLAFNTGKAWHVQVPPNMNVADLTLPNGEVRNAIPAYNQMMTIYGDQAGIYVLRDQNNPARTYEFAANFANARESDLARPPVELQAELFTTPSILEETPIAQKDALLVLLEKLPNSAQNIWVLALLLATFGLFAEWLTYHRRWTV